MLDKIIETKKEELKSLELPEKQEVVNYSLKNALEEKKDEVQIIAEVKKASPSKGLIREDFQPEEIAKSYEKGGAAALSVLTDVSYFQGSRGFLTAVKQSVSLPVMRKEFIIDSLQIKESARIGADALLLIAAALDPIQLHEMYEEAYEEGLEVLVEFHSKEELENVLNIFEPAIMGINNRNLHTFETTLKVTEQLKDYVPPESLLVSESGIYTYEDLRYVQERGAKAVLVGESLMRQENVEEALRKLKGEKMYG